MTPPAKPVLVDTSAWIEALRRDGRKEIREQVRTLLTEARAAWCEMVRLELWCGARGRGEQKKLRQLEKEIESLPADRAVWSLGCDLARTSRAAGRTFPATDFLIVACALRHEVEILHCDAHLGQILSMRPSEPAP